MLVCSTYYTISYEHIWKLYSLIFIQMKINFIKVRQITRKLSSLHKAKLVPDMAYYIDLSRMGSSRDVLCSFVSTPICTALTRHYFNSCYGYTLYPIFLHNVCFFVKDSCIGYVVIQYNS